MNKLSIISNYKIHFIENSNENITVNDPCKIMSS